jgi:hypothetical protein
MHSSNGSRVYSTFSRFGLQRIRGQCKVCGESSRREFIESAANVEICGQPQIVRHQLRVRFLGKRHSKSRPDEAQRLRQGEKLLRWSDPRAGFAEQCC